MKLAVMQPYFLPYLPYFQLINAVDCFIFLDNVNFINKGWINRNNILVNNEAHLINLPLVKASQNRLINSINIVDEEKWKSKLLKKVELSYKKAPLFEHVMPLFYKSLINDCKLISDLNQLSIELISDYLEIETKFKRSSDFTFEDQYNGQYKILELCSKNKAQLYINPIGGIELYDASVFNKREISLKFLNSGNTIYRQFKERFVNHLSILDVLMFNEKEQIKRFLDNYTLL